MNKSRQVKKHILDLLSDGKEHSTAEIKDYILSKNIKLEKNSTLIRNALYNLKHENPSLSNINRGKYKLISNSPTLHNDYSELKNAIAVIEKNLQEYKHFNWISCNDLELEIARSKTQMLINLSSKIKLEMSQFL